MSNANTASDPALLPRAGDPRDRRRHLVFRTRHTEYHLRDDQVVGVKDRETGLWILNHAALRLRALRLPRVAEATEWLGRRLAFWGGDADVVTSPVVEVDRPQREELRAYVSQARSGEITQERAEARLLASH